jgi:glycosyltransferase involved in cell wall biosynthesis
MKICFIADAKVIHTQRWVNYFARKGHDIHLITIRPGEGYAEGVQIHLLPALDSLSWPGAGLYKAFVWSLRTRRLVGSIKPDIINAHFITTYGYLAVFSGFHPVVLTPWGSDILIDPKRNRLYRFLTGYALRRAEMTLCNSETLKKEVVKLGASPARVQIIYNGIDTSKFHRQPGTVLKESLGVNGGPVIISTRNFLWVYNLEMLIRAVPLVLRHTPHARFAIAGDGNAEQRQTLEKLANSLGVLENILFLGLVPHDELPDYLSSSDIYVSTSLSDSSSLSLQEAMACELAPVVTDLSGNREWVNDGENGFIVPQNDSQALAKKVIYLIEHEEVRGIFGRLGRKIIQERAEYEKEMEKAGGLYEDLVRAQKSPGEISHA